MEHLTEQTRVTLAHEHIRDAVKRIVLTLVALVLTVAVLQFVWSRFNLLIQALIVLALVASFGVILAISVFQLYISTKHLHEDVRLRIAQRAALETETQVRARTVAFDDQANAALIHGGQIVQLRGNMREHPNLTNYHNAPKVTGITEEKTPLAELPAPVVAPLSFEETTRQIERNSFQLGLGSDLTSREPIIEEIADCHILLIGGTRKGKSCMAGQIMDQLTQTHDRDHILLALLDLEDQTCNLFAELPHVLRFNIAGRPPVKAIARNPHEVAQHLSWLVTVMDQRYQLTPRERARLPRIIMYLEEFVELKRRLKSNPALLSRLADNFTSLATRGLKANMHLMVCAQASYSQEEFREAMGQLIGINLSFSAPPRLAQAAGFLNYELLKTNRQANKPGQFVIESPRYNTLAQAPMYDVKAKLLALQDEEEQRSTVTGSVQVQEEYERNEPQNGARLIDMNARRTPVEPSGSNPVQSGWQAYVDVIERLQNEGHNQDAIILKIWHARKGGGQKYQEGRDIYRQCNEAIKQRRQATYERLEAVEG